MTFYNYSNKDIKITPKIEIIHENKANIVLPPTLPRTSPFFKNIPAPIEEPITNKIAEKNNLCIR